MSTDEEMQVIGRMVTEFAEVKRRITALEEQAWGYGKELVRVGNELNKIRLGSLDIDTASLPTREQLMELLADLRAARERHSQLLTSLRELGLDG